MINKNKYRYILVETSKEIGATYEDLNSYLEDQFLKLLGELTFLEAYPRVVSQITRNLFVIKVSRGFEPNIILSLIFIKGQNNDVGFYTLKTSGTIRTLIDFVDKMK